MTNLANDKKYDLEERTAKFGENVILFCRKLPRDEVTKPLVTQLIKAATSVVASAYTDCREDARLLWTEAKELHLIFNSIYRKIGITNIGHSLGQLEQLVQLE